MLSRNFRPQSLGVSGVSQAFCVLEQIMATDPKKQDEIKDEELESVSGGALESNSVPSEADVSATEPMDADVRAKPERLTVRPRTAATVES